MEDVATGGYAAYTKQGYLGMDYCELYPAYAPCIDPEPLPMLMALGYASGLAMANVAVAVSNMGQPALLYLVPTTLGALLVLAKRRGDLDTMWTGAGVTEEKQSDAR
ncbi:hypothetical protein PsorP6_012405 [Peronosclerospora sorghi]|uniref:Uncharacterized protein n=1 Tax=Peronosclerospora sorghi TaxID=230839 RepID=A0ACC0WHW7_9STRA|nr:hypothetical protein PsorP6_012405 [Peronosclerospora sorghi]